MKAEHKEFLERWDSENCSDTELVSFIDGHVINEEERQGLKRFRITIADAITGHYRGTQKLYAFLQSAFDRWNKAIGREVLFPPS